MKRYDVVRTTPGKWRITLSEREAGAMRSEYPGYDFDAPTPEYAAHCAAVLVPPGPPALLRVHVRDENNRLVQRLFVTDGPCRAKEVPATADTFRKETGITLKEARLRAAALIGPVRTGEAVDAGLAGLLGRRDAVGMFALICAGHSDSSKRQRRAFLRHALRA